MAEQQTNEPVNIDDIIEKVEIIERVSKKTDKPYKAYLITFESGRESMLFPLDRFEITAVLKEYENTKK